MKIISTSLLCLTFIICSAQMAMGSWKTYLSYGSVSQVEQSSNKIFGVSENALFSINKEDGLIESLTKVNGLNEISVSKIKFDESSKTLVISYSNGNIDLLTESNIYNIPDLKNKAISADKSTNDIVFDNNKAYICNGFGIIVLNLTKKEISDTYIVSNQQSTSGVYMPIKSCAFFNDSIYALSSNTLMCAPKNSNFLSNYQNWKSRPNLPQSNVLNTQILTFNNKLYLLKASGTIYYSEDALNWNKLNDNLYTNMHLSKDNLLLFTDSSIDNISKTGSSETLELSQCNDIIFDSNLSTYWIATDSNGISKLENKVITQTYKIEGPATNKLFKLKYSGGRLFGHTAYVWYISNESTPSTLSILDENKWTNYTTKELYPFTSKNFKGINSIAVDPTDKTHFYLGSWREGVYEFKNDKFFKLYDKTNSTIQNADNVDNSQTVHGVQLDNNQNLWLIQDKGSLPINLIKVKLYNDVWTEIQLDGLSSYSGFDKTIVTKDNVKWINNIRTGINGGVLIIDDNQDEIKSIFYSSVKDQDGESVSLVPSYCMAEDKDGSVWVGTNKGPVIFKNVSNVFSSNYTAYRVKIPRNDGTDYADYLLGNQKINDIAVDGSNRKWIATETGGVYLVSSDGLKSIHNFTNENSPLLSNNVSSIAVNDKTGEVYFATDLGLISYQSDASEGKANYQSISTFPNPVKENYSGVISFTGLTENSVVKITDSNGNLVYQTNSNGGTATWDGKTTKGDKAGAGVYYIMCSNATDSNSENFKTGIGKLLILK